MPNVSERKVKNKTADEASDEETDAAKKTRLMSQIRNLKFLIIQAKCNLNRTRFKDLRRQDKNMTRVTSATDDSSELSDVDATLQNELFSYAGFCCKKIDGELVVSFQSIHANWYTNENWIQLFKNEESTWRLGQWVMPMGVDVGVIFAKYSMNSSVDMKLFLRECKHLIDCHNRREQEFKDLEVFMSHMQRYGCSVEANYGYTNVIMKLIVKKLVASPIDAEKILVYMLYKNNKARPSRIFIDCEGENKLSHDRQEEFKKIFQCFKLFDLMEAAKRTLTSPNSLFIWKDASTNDSIVETNGDEANDMETSLSRLLQKKSNVAKKSRRVKSEVVGENSYDARKEDSNVDAVDVSDPEVCDVESSQVDSHRSKKRKLETVKRTKRVERKSGVRKINAAAKTRDRRSIPVAMLPDKSESPRALGKEYLPLTDFNRNVSSYAENIPSETTGKRSRNNDKVQSAVQKFFKSKNSRVNSGLPAGNDEKLTEKQKSVKEAEKIEIHRKKSQSNGVKSVSTPNSRSSDILLCSTPITERVAALSTIAEENISAIAKVNVINPRTIDAEESESAKYLRGFDNCDSDESDERDLTEVCKSQEALLKDLQAVKYNNNATDKAVTKSLKRKIKPSSRGRNKVPKQ